MNAIKTFAIRTHETFRACQYAAEPRIKILLSSDLRSTLSSENSEKSDTKRTQFVLCPKLNEYNSSSELIRIQCLSYLEIARTFRQVSK